MSMIVPWGSQGTIIRKKHKKLMEAGNLILDLWNCISLISAVFGR